GAAITPVTEFRAVPGLGVDALASDGRVLLGNAGLMAARGIGISALEARARELAEAGKSAVYVAFAGEARGFVAGACLLQPEAGSPARAIGELGPALA